MTAPTPHRAAVEAAARAVPRGGIGNHAIDGCDCPSCQECRALTQQAVEPVIKAYRAAMEAAGWRMVPRQWTTEMVEASTAHRCVLAEDHWLHMYDAAPPPEGG